MKVEFVFKNCILCLFTFYITGCSYFTPPREHPMLTNMFDEPNGFVVSATDANRRVALINLTGGQVCVEPPPEAANTISEAFTALFQAKVQDKADIAASLSKSISQNITQLYRRTQTVQLFRDSVFALCQNAVNGQLDISTDTVARLSPKQMSKLREVIKEFEDKSVDIDKSLFNSLTGTGNFKRDDLVAVAQIPVPAESNDLALAKEGMLNIMRQELINAEYSIQVSIMLENSFDTLRRELDHFYNTEKIRFLVELAKPVQVCTTKNEYEKTNDGKENKLKTSEQTCTLQKVDNMDHIIREFMGIYKNEPKDNEGNNGLEDNEGKNDLEDNEGKNDLEDKPG